MKVQTIESQSKGFSLVELIAVITIMAVMLTVSAIIVLPYINKAKETQDYKTIDGLCTAATSAFVHNANSLQESHPYQITSKKSLGDSWGDTPNKVVYNIKEFLGGDPSSDSIINLISNEFKSKEGKRADNLVIEYSADGAVLVQIYSGKNPVFDPISSK